VGFFAGAKLAEELRRGFPRSLDHAPMLLPATNTVLRRDLQTWFDSRGIRPQVVGEFEDNALMMTFGRAGWAAFPAAMALARDVRQQYAVKPFGRTREVRERFYVISMERRISHPAVAAILTAAQLAGHSVAKKLRPVLP
jgi:LysR family transcriptional activator of nhaA